MNVIEKINYYQEYAGRMKLNGYVAPLPLMIKGKIPIPPKWSTVVINDKRISYWSDTFSQSNVGLRTGDKTESGVLAALDIDIDRLDASNRVLRTLRDLINKHILVRYGNDPKFLVPIRVDEAFHSHIIELTPAPRIKGSPKIELLCKGRQFVAFGMHPDTGREYEWLNGRSPLNTPFEELQRVSINTLQEFISAL